MWTPPKGDMLMPVNRSLLRCLHPKNVDISLYKMHKIKVACLTLIIKHWEKPIKARTQADCHTQCMHNVLLELVHDSPIAFENSWLGNRSERLVHIHTRKTKKMPKLLSHKFFWLKVKVSFCSNMKSKWPLTRGGGAREPKLYRACCLDFMH